jgi:hypothetical protein
MQRRDQMTQAQGREIGTLQLRTQNNRPPRFAGCAARAGRASVGPMVAATRCVRCMR